MPATGSTPSDAPVRFGDIGMIFALPFLAARREGYFEEEGLTVEVSTFANGWEVAEALAKGTVDVGIGGHLQAAQTILGGADLVFLGPLGYEQDPENLVIALLGSPDMTSAADFAGKKVGVTTRGGQASLMLALFMEAADLELDAVELDAMGSAQIMAALANGSIDGAVLADPTAEKAVRQGARVVERGSLGAALAPGERVAITGVLARRAWVDEDEGRARRASQAIARGSALLRERPGAVVELMAKEGGLPVDLCETAVKPVFPAELRPGDLQLVYDQALRFDLLDRAVDATSIIHPIGLSG